MIYQYLALAFLLFSAALSVTSAWKSLATGKSQPASFFLERQGKQPIVRADRSFAFWNYTLPWLVLAPLTIVLTVGWIVPLLTWPTCSESIKEMCLYASN